MNSHLQQVVFPLTTSGKIQKYKLGEIGLKLLDERRERGEL